VGGVGKRRTSAHRYDRPSVSAPRPFRVSFETTPAAMVLALSGELDVAVAAQLRTRLDELEVGRGDTLVIDMSDLDFIDSSGLRVLVVTHQRAHRDGFRMVLVQGSDAVRRILQLTRLDEQLEIVASRDAVRTG
jgi:anti-sigma B factor antagonist